MQLTTKQLRTLEAACDGLLPALEPGGGGEAGFWHRKASDLEVAAAIPRLLGELTDKEKKDFRGLLGLLGSPLLGLTWGGPFKPMTALSQEQRERLLQRWSMSRLPHLRKGFQALKKLACFLFYGVAPAHRPNPNWEAMGYPGPPGDAPPGEPPLPVWVPATETEISCDVVVVGSGAGGGLAAGLLAESGQEVVLLEKGPYLRDEEMTQRETEMVGRLYEARGALATVDGGTAVFAGSCLGGGTTVNWTGCFRTPGWLLEDWAADHGLPQLTSDTFQRGLDEIARHLGVSSEASPDNPQNAALRRASTALGQQVAAIPRNVTCRGVDGCHSCGFCSLGCRAGHKRGTLKTWIPRAVRAGARVVPDTEALRVRLEGGRAVGVEALHTASDGRRLPLFIRAARVVVAAGSLHTPALLLRSGLEHPEIGRHLHIHPTVAIGGYYPEVMDSWYGPMMSVVNDQFADLDRHWGFRIETPPLHPGLMGLALPWVSARQHRENMLRARHLGTFIILLRDRHGGRVTVDRAGRPRIHYRLHPYDRGHVLRGIAEGARLHLEAGAERLFLPHGSFPEHRRQDGPEALERLLQHTFAASWAANAFPLFTAHQMGTCRMGGRRRDAPLSPEGRLWEVPNLWVTDASAFPAASGVNPMITIMGLSWQTVQGMVA